MHPVLRNLQQRGPLCVCRQENGERPGGDLLVSRDVWLSSTRIASSSPPQRVAVNAALASRPAAGGALSLNIGRCASMSSARQSLGPSAQGRSSGPIPSEPVTARMSTAPSPESRVVLVAEGYLPKRRKEAVSLSGDELSIAEEIRLVPDRVRPTKAEIGSIHHVRQLGSRGPGPYHLCYDSRDISSERTRKPNQKQTPELFLAQE